MPDLKQALKDFVATSNSGKYTDEQTLLSKFPELKGYDINVLKDFVATSNSGKYKTEDEIFSKFPEFSQQPQAIKKNETLQPPSMGLSSEGGLLGSQEGTSNQPPVDFQNYLKESKRLADIGTTRPGDIASLKGVIPQESAYVKEEKETLKKATEFTQKRKEDAIVNTAKRRLRTYSQVGSEVKENEVSQDALNNEISNVKKLLREGDLVQVSDKKGNPILAPTSTFFESVGDALTESIQAPVDATSINIATAKSLATGDDSDLIKILDEKIAEQPDVPERVASGFVGGMGELIGSVAKPIALARINPKLMVAEAAYTGFANNLLRLYQEGLNQGLTPSEAISKAKAPALAGAGFDAAAAYALTRIHPSGKGGIVSNLISKAPQETAKKVFVDAIGNTLKSASKFAAISASSTTGKNVSEKIGGYDRDLDKMVSDALESGKEGFIMDLGFKVIGGVGDLARIPKYVKSTAKEYLSTLPKGIVNARLESMGSFGENIKNKLNNYREIKKQFEGVVPKEQIPTFASWQERLNSLRENNAELQGKLNMGIAEAAQEPIRNQIESNNKEIQVINSRLEQYLKTNRIVESDLAGNQLNTQETESLEKISKAYSEDLSDIDKSIEDLDKNSYDYDFKLEELQKQRNEVVDYYENQLKNQENAIQEQATNAGVLRSEQPEMGLQEMGEGNAQPETTTGTEETIITQKPKEEIVDPLKDVESTTKALDADKIKQIEDVTDIDADVSTLNEGTTPEQYVASMYHLAKADGSNPELVKAVENLLGGPKEAGSVGVGRDVTFDNAKDGDVVIHNGNSVTVIGKTKSRGGNDIVEVKQNPKTKEQIKADALQNVFNKVANEYKKLNPTWADIEANHPSEVRAEIERLTALENSRTSTYSIDAEQWNNEVKAAEQSLKETPKTETPKGRFEKIGDKVADSIMNFELPDWAKIDNTEGINVQGTDSAKLKEMIAGAVKKVGKMMDNGVDFAVAIKDATKELVDLFGEKVRGKIESTIADHFNKGEGLSEDELPGYNRAMDIVEGIVEKTKSRADGTNEKAFENAINYLQQDSKVYENASDVQRELLIREMRRRFGLKEKSAPKAGKLLEGIKDIAKITMTEKDALVKQIKDLARGAKDAKTAITTSMVDLSKAVKELASSGKITPKQAANVLRKFADTNFLKSESVERFTDYMVKVFNKAEYADKLSKAKDTKSDISKLSANKENNANLTALGKEFAKIDPSMVEDIDAYNEMALKIKESLTGSKAVKDNVKFADIVNIEKAAEYIENALEEQNKKLFEYKVQEVQDAMGVDASKLSYEQLKEMLETDKPLTDYEEKIVRSAAMKMFDINSTIIKSIIEIGKDPFTGEDVEFSESQSKLVERFMDMDLRELTPKEALQAVDALTNFLQNKSTAKMEAVVEKYTGNKNVKTLVESGVKSREIKKAYSPGLGRILADLFNNANMIIEKMFPGVNRAQNIRDKMGLTDVRNGASDAIKKADNIIDGFINKFYKKEANGKDYTMSYNHIERGMAAEMIRSVIGTEEQIQKDFNKKKSWIEQSIERLKQGDDTKKAKAKLYQEVYDKILKDSKNAKDVIAKTDKANLEGVNYWIDELANNYDQMSDVSENVYNTLLKRENNYTSRKFSFLEGNDTNDNIDIEESSFHGNNNSVLSDKSANLKEINEDFEKLPDNMYLDLSFDRNMANSISNILIDINTAGPIRRVNAFVNSPYFKKLIPYSKDYKLLKGDKDNVGRIKLAIQNIRNKRFVSNDELSNAIKVMNKASKIGVGQVLGGFAQPITQIVPVATSTLINTSGKLNLGATFNIDKLNFINNSGYGIAIRGRKSQANIESVDKIIEKAASTKGQKALNAIPSVLEKTSEIYTKHLLENRDLYIAKASWLSYYEQALEKQGEDVSKIDYKKHKLNKKAADFAEAQVSRQQNENMQQFAGRIYSNKDAASQIIAKMLLSFSSFRMNASARLTADMITIKDKTSSKEDKVIAWKSLSGYAAEMATFRAVKLGASLLLGTLAYKMLGKDESDEDYEKRKSNLLKQARTSATVDLFSYAPVIDVPVQKAASFVTNKIEEITKLPISTYDVKPQDFTKTLGSLGIPFERAYQIWKFGNLAATGEFTDDFGRKRYISQSDKDALAKLTPISVAANLGLLPTEFSTTVNYAAKYAKKNASSKEGGKSDQDLQYDEEIKSMQEQNRIEKNAEKQDKISAIRTLIDKENDEDKIKSLRDNLIELEMSEEDLKKYKEDRKYEKFIENKEKKSLLGKYDNESDMKKYEPDLYEKNFGENSDYYKKHKLDNEVSSMINKEVTKEEEKENNYTSKSKGGLFGSPSKTNNSGGLFKKRKW